MRNVYAILFGFIVSVVTMNSAMAQQDVDLEAVMKKMGHSYKLAVKADSAEAMLSALSQFENYLSQAQQAKFKNEAQKSQKGLDEVFEQVEIARSLAQNQQLDAAKEALAKIDVLRKDYHKLHEPPGFWELLFGK
ncbi:cytochrome b562 [Pseudoalteromonas sp. YIC-656]|uniref:cytochrome b562 n=1 Tax=Pseudoalteromonas pernae TaxID=3118054 RepID=UPI003242794B